MALQEIKCDEAQLLSQMFECRKKGWEWTAGQALRRKSRAEAATDGSEGDLGCGGTAIMTRSPLSQTKIRPKDDAERELYDTGRWCGSGIPVAAATVMMLLHCFYGVSGSSLSKRRENERWLRALLELLKKAGRRLPVVVCMDANLVIEHSDLLQSFMQQRGFREAAVLHHGRGEGRRSRPTPSTVSSGEAGWTSRGPTRSC